MTKKIIYNKYNNLLGVSHLFRQLMYSGFSFQSIIYVFIRAIVVLFAICIHETAHGFAALKLGDPTAKYDGRLSLNPLRHIDPIGALCMFFFGFGWAKPVMVNPNYFKNLKRDSALTALAGPVANILLAYIATLCYVHLVPIVNNVYFLLFIKLLLSINIGLAIFNLIPIPPLDGSKIFLTLLPQRIYYEIMRYERFGFIVLAAALYLGVLDPILSFFSNIILRMLIFLAGGGI